MKAIRNNFAYIDGANLHNAMLSLGWELDYSRFRVWLSDKYKIKHAYIFIGLVLKYGQLYKYLQEAGFTLVFKEVTYDGLGKPKGNCDADLVLQTVCDAYENKCNGAVIVSSDGDYASLVHFLKSKDRCIGILSPSGKDKCSILLKRTGVRIAYINDQRNLLELRRHKEKAPNGDETP